MNWADIRNRDVRPTGDGWSPRNRMGRDPLGVRAFQMLGSHISKGVVVWRLRHISIRTAVKRNSRYRERIRKANES